MPRPTPPPAPPITRRSAVAAGLGAAALGLGAAAKRPARPPNIVFILADDLGYADLSCYGRRDYQTPHIDALAANGLRFTQAYANSAVCSATRTALITGRYEGRLPIGLEEPLTDESPRVGLPPGHATLPSLLKAAGYATTLIGKWHLGELPDYGPLKSGYDHFYGFRGGAQDYFSHAGPHGLWRDDRPAPEPGYLTELLGREAERVIGEGAASGRPFFVSLHFNAPHWPWEGPGDAAESARLKQPGGSLHDFDGGSRRTYAAMVQAMDAEVGRVLAALKRHGVAEDTIVVFTSDNGGERFSDTWPFKGQKTELLEGGLRIPAIVAWPGVIPRGQVSEQVMISMDWLPTLLAAAGAAPDPAYPSDGMDLRLRAPPAAPIPRALFWRYKANRQRAARVGDLKYLKIGDNGFLFDVANDPAERANLKDRRPADYAALAARWVAWDRTMLPEIAASFSDGITAAHQADHYGVERIPLAPDNPS